MDKELQGSKILDVEVRYAGRLNVPAFEFRRVVRGASVASVGRRAKLLLINMSNGWTMVVHLKMTGRFLLHKAGMTPTKHTHLVFVLSGGRILFFEDVRKLGFVKLFKTAELEEKVFDKEAYGPEPLDPSFTKEKFARSVRGRRAKRIKPLLMDQTCIAGVGNIYADEACWLAKVKPTRPADSLSDAELAGLFKGIRKVLNDSLRVRGTSADTYLDLYGRKGDNVPNLEVYDRQGKPCSRCGGILKKIRLGGRGAHYCPKCQR